MNEELAATLVAEYPKATKFFQTNVLETSSIAAAVQGSLQWIKQTGYELGGVVAAAGVSTPAKVNPHFCTCLLCEAAANWYAQIIDRNGKPFNLDDFDFVMNVNVRGTVDLIRQALPHLTTVPPTAPDNERGVLILVASAAAFDGQPGQVAYSASKGAIASLTLPLTRDLARFGVRVVTIAPSLFKSNMTAMMSDKVRGSLERVMEFPKREGLPEEFSALVKHAVENVMLNGTVLRLDGGMRMPSKM
jgi:3-hydroxyacyl-CoA dehydrogenase/3-hydroxy-2-methylbutyryl-CoA dehydrogenase